MAQAPRSQNNYSGPHVLEFLKWMRANLLYAVSSADTEERSSFLPISNAKAYLAENNHVRLDDILDELFRPLDMEPPVDSETILSNYTAIFCILIDIGCGAAIGEFVTHDHNDQQLPFDPQHEPPGLPPDTGGDFFEKFCKTQFTFCVPIFLKNMARNYAPDRILPIREKRKLASGGSATIYEIKLHSSYDKLLRGFSTADPNDPLCHTYALKTYRTPEAAKYYHCEVAAFRGLNRTGNPFLIGFYGNYIQGDSYNVILEYADEGSLEEYFAKHNPPDEEEDIIKFWTSLFGIFKALASIHSAKRNNDPEAKVLNGWHQDVKPRNILVVSNRAASPYEYLFKLADLGLSHFKMAIEGERPGTADDAYGTQTYGAPECFRDDSFWDEAPLEVGQKVDIWSFGCILSEAAVWMAKGFAGLQKYRSDRRKATEQITDRLGDCFHDGKSVLPIVHRRDDFIRTSLRNCDHITLGVLKMVKDDMLRIPDERLDAKQLWGRAKDLINGSPAGTLAFNTLLTGRGSMNVVSSTGSRLPHHSPPSQWNQHTSKQLQQTPTKPSRFSGYSGASANGGLAMVFEKAHVAEPDTLSNYAEETHIDRGQNYGKLGRPTSQPAVPIERPETQNFISDNQIYNQPYRQSLKGSFDQDLSQAARAGSPSLRGPGFAPDQRNQIISQSDPFLASVPRTYPVRPGPSTKPRDEDPHGLYGASDDEGEYRQSHQQESSDSSLPRISQHRQPVWISPHQDQPQRPNPNSSPTTIPSSPPAIYQAEPIIASPTIPVQATATPQPPYPQDKSKPSGPSKRQVAAKKLRNLPLSTALDWRQKKKENDNWKNKLKWKKREELRLPGDYLLGRVGKRDHVFIVDDSETMRQHWEEMCILFGILAYIVKTTDDNGIDMYFTMTERKYTDKDVSRLVDIVSKRKNSLEGDSNINLRLGYILNEYDGALRNEIALRKSHSRYAPANDRKPLTVYILTNALWSKKSDPTKAIKNIVDSLVSLGCTASRVGIQFISFGDNREALARLERYDSGLGFELDIVDHTKSTGNLWKMILGAIDPEFDGDSDDEDSVADDKNDR